MAAHAERYPAWQLPDAYKLLHQATLGSEHAIADPEAPRAWLTRELATLGNGPDEPVADTLGAFVRIHLRPFLSRGGDATALLDAFIQTANAPTDTADLACALQALDAMAANNAIPWSTAAVRGYVAARRAEGYPAVHHSDAFRSAYQPAYRLVGREMVGGLVRGEGDATAGAAAPPFFPLPRSGTPNPFPHQRVKQRPAPSSGVLHATSACRSPRRSVPRACGAGPRTDHHPEGAGVGSPLREEPTA